MRKTIGTLFLGILLAVLAGGLWQRAHQYPVATVDPYPHNHAVAAPKPKPPEGVMIPALPKAWYEVARIHAIDASFPVKGWTAYRLGTDALRRDDMKIEYTGQFASTGQAQLAVTDESNYERLRDGYPPLPARIFKEGAVDIINPESPAYFVFFVPAQPQQQAAFPKTGLQLGLMILGKLEAANQPPAQVTAQVDQIISVFTDTVQAEKLRNILAKPREPQGVTIPPPTQ